MEHLVNYLFGVSGVVFGIILSWLSVKFNFTGLLIGCIIGFILSWVFVKFRFQNGNFQVNETDADKDVYKLIINDFDKLHKRRYLLVRITRK